MCNKATKLGKKREVGGECETRSVRVKQRKVQSMFKGSYARSRGSANENNRKVGTPGVSGNRIPLSAPFERMKLLDVSQVIFHQYTSLRLRFNSNDRAIGHIIQITCKLPTRHHGEKVMASDQDYVVDTKAAQLKAEEKTLVANLYAAALHEDSSSDEVDDDEPEDNAVHNTRRVTHHEPPQRSMSTNYRGNGVQETLCRHPDYPSLVQAAVRLPHPSDRGWHEQFDELPESNAGTTTPNRIDSQKRQELPWVLVTGKPYGFERGEGQWEKTLELDFFFRLLDPVTNTYQEALHCFKFLKEIHSNDQPVEVGQDAEYVKLRSWGRWTIVEICALYTAINKFRRINGVKQSVICCAELFNSALRAVLDELNAAGNKERRTDVIRSMIRNASSTRYRPLFNLAAECAAMRARRELPIR
ncbi:uncharacterized protein M421DRAFT_407503 [Didymella exigua CBS 183.55]|uniref:Uncharacterized protein n=1 Tax=Didymella exigua CBS 183.55 TaxID=1150837 RepID=A0A6A5R7K1_9PLEO|nr:uncharacterized protein M421DRAFT_407503 [Didymella exigua CBS 183.55]KAF1923180.1 hypothetical protein M421DRAFT_407503 [Didymella exigua CBS 183.55]